MLQPELCRKRVERLKRDLLVFADAVVLASPQHVYYTTGHLPGAQHMAAVIITGDSTTLISANRPDERAAADHRLTYEANPMGTLRMDQPDIVCMQVMQLLSEGGRPARTVAVDTSPVTGRFGLHGNLRLLPADQNVWKLRRVKDEDELGLLRRAGRAAVAMFEAAAEVIRPGVAELDVYSALHAAAVRSAGEPLSAPLGNDFACNAGGGPARGGHVAGAGEMYIIDAGPAVGGYFGDACRTYAVGGKPSAAQVKAHAAVASTVEFVESLLVPGKSCRVIFEAASKHLKKLSGQAMTHHLGHGTGLVAHEYPHLNPKWDDTLMEGEVLTVEPGVYSAELRAGVRLENMYLVRKSGVENLTPYPLGLGGAM